MEAAGFPERQTLPSVINARRVQLTSMLTVSQATMSCLSASVFFLLAPTSTYSGDPDSYKCFMLQCSLYFSSQEDVDEKTKISLYIELLTDKALIWATDSWSGRGEHTTSYKHFLQLL